MRFEPGQQREVELVALGGARIVYGFQGKVMGPLEAKARTAKPPVKAAARKTAAGANKKASRK